MRNFKSINGEELELTGEVKMYGILENQDGLYELCDKNDDNSFAIVEVIEEDGNKYVGFNEVSQWADSNIIVGSF